MSDKQMDLLFKIWSVVMGACMATLLIILVVLILGLMGVIVL